MAAAIGAVVVAAGGWGTVATVALAAASFAYAYSVQKKAKGASQEPAERKQVLRSSSAPKNYVYGRTRSSGLLVFAQEEQGDQTDGEWIHLVLANAGHKMNSITNVMLNEESITNYPDHSSFAAYPEGRNDADPFLLANCPGWTSGMIGKDIAWSRVSLKFDQEKFPSGLPNITMEKEGFKVEDIRNGSVQWSDNPALCILHFLRLKGWEDEYLILDTFKEAANICDEEISIPTGGSERRYRIGCEFDDSDTPASVLDKMLASCGGEWVRVGGRIGLRVAAYYGPAFIEITEDDIIDGIEIQPEVDRSSSFNIVRGTFVDPSQNYTEVDYPEVKVDEWVTDDGEQIVMDFDLNYVQSGWQAQRLADIALKRSRLGMTMKLPCNLRGFQATPGTMINLSLPTIGFNKTEFMVVDWEFSIDGGVALVVRRDLPSFYNDAVGRPVVPPPLIDLPTGGVPAPTNPLFSAKAVGDVVQGVISWTNSVFQISYTNVIIKDNGGFIVQSAQVPFPSSELPLNGRLAGDYDIELQNVAVNGAKSTVTKMTITISEPQTPDVVSVKASNWSIHLIPGYALGSVPFGTLFEFYVDETQQTDPPPADREPNEVASSWNQGGLTPDNYYYYWIRAVNSYGKSGWVQKTVKTTRETGLVETLVEKLIGIEIYAPYIASDDTDNPAFLLDGRPDHGNGLIKGATIEASTMKSDNYIAGTTGFQLTRDSAEFNSNAVFRGTLSAASGSFTGTVQADKIIGDVVSATVMGIDTGNKSTSGAQWITIGTVRCRNNNTRAGIFYLSPIPMYHSITSSSPESAWYVNFGARILRNGSVAAQIYERTNGSGRETVATTYSSPSFAQNMNPGDDYTFTLQILSGPSSGQYIGHAKSLSSSVAPQFIVRGSAFP